MKPPAFPLPLTDPGPAYRPRDALYAADLLTAGVVHLDLFTRLAARPLDRPGICRELELKDRPVDVMLTLFTAQGFLEKTGEVYGVTPLAREHFVRGSPWFLGPYYASFKDRPICLDFLNVLRTDRTASWGGGQGQEDWAKSMEDPAFAERFTQAMDCRGAVLGAALARALDLSRSRRLLDVAGGSGIYACALVDAQPGLTASVLEKPPVDRVARAAIARRGFTDRVDVVAGDMFTGAWPGGHDAHLISNVIHDWDVPRVEAILRSSHAALEKGGLVIIHDAHLNDQKTGPLEVAEYSVLLLHACEGRCYSVAEMRGFLEKAGFGEIVHLPTAAWRSAVVGRKTARG
jgi:predicted O-methyltransferase YrrM